MYTDWLRTNGFTTETAPAPKRANNSRKINPVLGKYAHPEPAKAAPVEVVAPSPVKAIEKMVTVQTYHAYNDPAHGWIKVSLAELNRLGIADKITAWSYKKGEYAYLEEDCDYTAWVKAKTAAGEPYAVKDHYCDGRSKIRTYASYKPFDQKGATIPQDEQKADEPVKVTAPAENPVVVAPSVTTAAPADTLPGTTIYNTPQWEGLDIYGNPLGVFPKNEPHSTQVISACGWVVSKPIGFIPREISPEWYTIPYHHPIPGAIITAGDPGKVTIKFAPDGDFKSPLTWLCEKHGGKYSKKAGGYVMKWKQFADFVYAKNNSGIVK